MTVTDHQHLRVAEEAAHMLGEAAPVLIRKNVASLWRIGDVAVRVSQTTRGVDVIRIAEVVARYGIPTPRPIVNTPWKIGACEVTVWEWLETVDAAIDWSRVGQLAHILHSMSIDDLQDVLRNLSTVEVVERSRINHRLDLLSGRFDEEILSMLKDQSTHLLRTLEDKTYEVASVLLHGDLNPGNVLHVRDGPVLLDWELARLGPPQWDHVPLLIHTRRFGMPPSCYEVFAEGYGERYDDDELANVMCRLRELSITLGQLRRAVLGGDAAEHQEAARRLLYWTDPEHSSEVPWTAR